jgi:hypothetical protein
VRSDPARPKTLAGDRRRGRAMRKVLLFLLFFGAGLTVLLILRQQRESAHPVGEESTGGPVKPAEMTDVGPQGLPQGEKQGRVAIILRGVFDATKFSGEGDTKKRLYVVHSDNVEARAPDVYDLFKLTIDVYDPQTEALRAHLVSPQSRVRITLRNGQPEMGENDRVYLADAEVTLHEGAPVVPLVLRVPLLEWNVAAGRFASKDHVHLEGTGLHAEGTGMDLDTKTSVLRLERDGIIDLSFTNDRGATLAAARDGPIVIQKIESGTAPPEADILATQGARLAFSDVKPLPAPPEKNQRIQVNAETIHLRGHAGAREHEDFDVTAADAEGHVVADGPNEKIQADHAAFVLGPASRLQRADFSGGVAMHRGDEAFWSDVAQFTFGPEGEIVRADLDGKVDLDRGSDHFHSQKATFAFGPKGELTRAELSGEPNGSINVADYLPSDAAPNAVRGLGAAQAEIRGAGPLVLEFAEGTQLSMPGPAEVSIAELRFLLTAQHSLRGVLDADRKSGRLYADGSAHAVYEDSDADSDSLEIHYTVLHAGEELVNLFTNGWTTAHLATPARGRIQVEALDGLQVQSRDRRLTLPIARGATFTAPGPKGFEARADLMRDVDWDAQTFNAQGHVIFEDAEGRGTAAVAIARGRDDLSLFGVDGEPARYFLWRDPSVANVAAASVEAREIHRRGDDIESRGDVKAFVEAEAEVYRVESDSLNVTLFRPIDLVAAPLRPFAAVARDHVRARVTSDGTESTLSSNRLFIDGLLRSPKRKLEGAEIASSNLRAEGDVEVAYGGAGGWTGDGDLLTLDQRRRGRLSTGAGRRVHARWRAAPDGFQYALDADWIDFDRNHIEASNVEVHEAGPSPAPPALGAPQDASSAQRGSAALIEMRADHFEADDEHVFLTGRAHARGRTEHGGSWGIDAGAIRVAGKWKEKPFTARDVESIEASEGFTAELGGEMRAQGEHMVANSRRMRMEGAPAKLVLPVFECRSKWIQYDVETMLISTDNGDLVPGPSSKDQDWTLTYSSLRPLEQPDNTIMVVRDPVFRRGEMEAHAEWLLFWIDRDEWQKYGDLVMHKRSLSPDLRITEPEPEPEPDQKTHEHQILKKELKVFRSKPVARVLNEAYVEGNVEIFQAGERRARASAIYLDLKEARGWVQDADIFVDVFVRDIPQRLRAMAKWMRISTDLSLRADNASITACDYGVPHYVVETGDLEIKPGESFGEPTWDVAAHDNWLRLQSGIAIPLPPIVYPANKKGQPLINEIVLSQSAQFGTSLRAAFNVPLGTVGTGAAKAVGKLFSLPETDLDGHWKFDAGILQTRGVILGAGFILTSKDKFRMDMEFSGIPDRGEDRGLVRVPEDERGIVRDWFRLRSRYNFDPEQWIDFAMSVQSDPGVQSEFFEHDYLNYEQKDNYVHWRKANDQYYTAASVKWLMEDRTDLAELPQAFFGRGRSPVGELWGMPLLYTAYGNAGYFQRKNGDPEFYPQYPDGLGDREAARVDTEHRLELPFQLGFGGLRMTPFTAVRGTAWSEAESGSDAPARVGLFAGADVSTTYWKRFSNGYVNTISPTVSFHGDLASYESAPPPVQFDRTEDPITGKFVDLALRTRLWKPTSQNQLDFEVRTSYGFDVGPTQPDGLQPIAVLGEFLTAVGNVPLGFKQDARYDVRGGHTTYSDTSVGFEPHPKLDIEGGYHRGDNVTETGDFVSVLYESASIGARYKLSAKWEIQFQESIALNDNTGFAHDFTIRRIGHDFVLDLGIGYREGQGAAFGFRFTPRYSWKRPGIGLMDQYFGVNR